LIYTGARAQEALNIRGTDLNLETETVFIRGLKGSDDRELPLPSWLFKQLVELRAKHTGEFLFPISYPRLDQIWREYRPVKKKLHSLRHTFAIRLLRKTGNLRLVQVALGHRSISNTMVYASYQYQAEELKKLIL
jgi:integrase/recombinase XerC